MQKNVVAILCCLSLLGLTQQAKARVLFVKSNALGANNGSSWFDAYTDLQAAITAGTVGDSIWIAAATYKPTSTTTKTISFNLKNGVSLFGGFAGSEAFFNERNVVLNPTILSGNIGDIGTNNDNSYHVIYSSTGVGNTTILDGLTIKDGYANDPLNSGGGIENRGAGMYNEFGNPTVNNCKFTNNYARTRGGGLYNHQSTSSFNNCVFQYDTSDNGGGLANEFSSLTTYTNCLISDNIAMHSVFPNSGYGGGCYNSNVSSAAYINCQFTNNKSNYIGGGIISFNSAHISLIGCVITNNTAANDGGGMYTEFNTAPQLYNCLIYNNTALRNGGGIYLGYNTSGSNSVLRNTTIIKNKCTTGQGAGIYIDTHSPIINNTMIWGNYRNNSHAGSYILNGSLVYSNSLLIDNSGNFITGSFNVAANPQLVDTALNNFRLTLCSPAVNAGVNAAVPISITTDIDGNPRKAFSIVDIGAYELGAAAFANVLNTADVTSIADVELPDANGWTHYFNCARKEWILSLKKNGQNIGTIGTPGFLVSSITRSGYDDLPASAFDLTAAQYVNATHWLVMKRYWRVTPVTQPTDSVGVLFPYTTTDYNSVKNSYDLVQPGVVTQHEAMRFFKIENHDAHHLNVLPSEFKLYKSGVNASKTAWKYNNVGAGVHSAELYVTSFSGGGGGVGSGTNNGPILVLLPLKLISFSGVKKNNEVSLWWETSSESNLDGFYVEKSVDGVNFTNVGFVSAHNRDAHASYTFKDLARASESVFYRLTIKERGGAERLSHVIRLFEEQGNKIEIFPNPAKTYFSVSNLTEASKITLVNLIGVTVQEWNVVRGQNVFNLNRIKPGVYFIILANKNNRQVAKLKVE
ncbi:MAG: hypothetical protein RIR12_1432 [Bacteroidota bacterium]|jgi:hypothetical protein